MNKRLEIGTLQKMSKRPINIENSGKCTMQCPTAYQTSKDEKDITKSLQEWGATGTPLYNCSECVPVQPNWHTIYQIMSRAEYRHAYVPIIALLSTYTTEIRYMGS